MSRRFVAVLVAFGAVGLAAAWGPKPNAVPVAVAPPSSQPDAVAFGSGGPTAALALAAASVRVSATPDGSTVLGVHLTARVHSAVAIAIGADGTTPALRFALSAPRSAGVVGALRSPAPEALAAGSTTAFDLTFDLRGLSFLPGLGSNVASVPQVAPAPGVWLLQLDLVDASGVRYHAETPVTVEPSA